MDRKQFKKLLIDLDLSITEIGAEVNLSRTGVRMYFDSALRDRTRRRQIRAVLARRAREVKVPLPDFWSETRDKAA